MHAVWLVVKVSATELLLFAHKWARSCEPWFNQSFVSTEGVGESSRVSEVPIKRGEEMGCSRDIGANLAVLTLSDGHINLYVLVPGAFFFA